MTGVDIADVDAALRKIRDFITLLEHNHMAWDKRTDSCGTPEAALVADALGVPLEHLLASCPRCGGRPPVRIPVPAVRSGDDGMTTADNWHDVAASIKRLRNEHEWTQQELSERSGVTRATIRNAEHAKG